MGRPRELTRQEMTAGRFRCFRSGLSLSRNANLRAQPLVLEAAGVPPNDPTNSHQAVAIPSAKPDLKPFFNAGDARSM
jgi:hypothetical protein